MLIDSGEGSSIPLDPTAELHATSRIPLDPMVKSIAKSIIQRHLTTKAGFRIKKDLTAKSMAEPIMAIGSHDVHKCNDKYACCFLQHMQHQTMLLSGFPDKHSTDSVWHRSRFCSAEGWHDIISVSCPARGHIFPQNIMLCNKYQVSSNKHQCFRHCAITCNVLGLAVFVLILSIAYQCAMADWYFYMKNSSWLEPVNFARYIHAQMITSCISCVQEFQSKARH